MKNKKGKAKKKNNSSKNKVCLNDEKLIKIYEEACYRALKRIENEKEKQNDEEITKDKVKYTWYENLLFVLNVLIWPWKPSKKFKLKSNIYDNVLVAFVSSIMQIVGAFLWLFGILLVPLFYHL